MMMDQQWSLKRRFLQQECLWNLVLQVVITEANGAVGLQQPQLHHHYPLQQCEERLQQTFLNLMAHGISWWLENQEGKFFSPAFKIGFMFSVGPLLPRIYLLPFPLLCWLSRLRICDGHQALLCVKVDSINYLFLYLPAKTNNYLIT